MFNTERLRNTKTNSTTQTCIQRGLETQIQKQGFETQRHRDIETRRMIFLATFSLRSKLIARCLHVLYIRIANKNTERLRNTKTKTYIQRHRDRHRDSVTRRMMLRELLYPCSRRLPTRHTQSSFPLPPLQIETTPPPPSPFPLPPSPSSLYPF